MLLALAGAVAAQPNDWFASVHPDMTGMRYGPLARQARISGIVKLKVSPGTLEIIVESGPSILVSGAKDNLAKWRFDPPLTEPIIVEYVFRLPGQTCTNETVPRSNAFGLFFLRILEKPTDKIVADCEENTLPEVEGPMAALSGERKITVLVTAQPLVEINFEATKATE
jgi:hypothetical protein